MVWSHINQKVQYCVKLCWQVRSRGQNQRDKYGVKCLLGTFHPFLSPQPGGTFHPFLSPTARWGWRAPWKALHPLLLAGQGKLRPTESWRWSAPFCWPAILACSCSPFKGAAPGSLRQLSRSGVTSPYQPNCLGPIHTAHLKGLHQGTRQLSQGGEHSPCGSNYLGPAHTAYLKQLHQAPWGRWTGSEISPCQLRCLRMTGLAPLNGLHKQSLLTSPAVSGSLM